MCVSLYGLGLTFKKSTLNCAQQTLKTVPPPIPPQPSHPFFGSTLTFYWLHMDAIQLKRLQLSFMGCWLIGSFFGQGRYAPLCISSSMCFAVFGFFLLFSKCPLIGCTVTVSCFKRPMWHLKVAYLTPTPCGEETSYSAAKTNERGRFVVSFFYFIFFNLTRPSPPFLLHPFLPTNMRFERRLRGGPLPKQNPLGFNTFS